MSRRTVWSIKGPTDRLVAALSQEGLQPHDLSTYDQAALLVVFVGMERYVDDWVQNCRVDLDAVRATLRRGQLSRSESINAKLVLALQMAESVQARDLFLGDLGEYHSALVVLAFAVVRQLTSLAEVCASGLMDVSSLSG